MILSDRQIKERRGMIEPFVDHQVNEGVISYGLSSFGYDIRISDKFKIFSNAHSVIVDPKNLDERSMVDHQGGYCMIPPNSFILAKSIEVMNMPRDVTGLVTCKSTYARLGILIPTTVLEAGWRGEITLEVSNATPLPAKVYANEGIAQVLFFTGEPCGISYDDRQGKYQDQQGVTLPTVRK